MTIEKRLAERNVRIMRPTVWDLGKIRQLTKGGEGPTEEENIVWGTEPMVFVPDSDR
jgi:hypothetical protein